MTANEMKRAKVNDRVKYEPLTHDAGDYCEGTIVDVGPDSITIAWDDGETHLAKPSSYSRVFFK